MYQFFSRPDAWAGLCGHLDCACVTWRMRGPAFMRGIRAVFATDFHATARTTAADMDRLAARIQALAPDLLLLGGDYADTPEPIAPLFKALSTLKCPLGRFGAAGNNDREAWPDIDDLRRTMAKGGCRLLVNEAAEIAANGGRLIVAGIDEYRYGTPDARGLYPEASEPGTFRLLLSHFPIIPDPLPDAMLSGHTHGGQFNLLGFTPYTIGFERSPGSNRASRFIAGLHDYRGAQVLVSKGIGASRLPFRLFVRPEIELIEFC